MKKLWLLAVVFVLLWAVPLQAQEVELELYGGYARTSFRDSGLLIEGTIESGDTREEFELDLRDGRGVYVGGLHDVLEGWKVYLEYVRLYSRDGYFYQSAPAGLDMEIEQELKLTGLRAGGAYTLPVREDLSLDIIGDIGYYGGEQERIIEVNGERVDSRTLEMDGSLGYRGGVRVSYLVGNVVQLQGTVAYRVLSMDFENERSHDLGGGEFILGASVPVSF